MPKPAQVIDSHWSQLIEDLEASPLGFYDQVEEAIERREIPDVELSRHDWREAGPMSAKRTYLRVSREDDVIDICGAPFGRGFFVSEWAGPKPYGMADWLLPWRLPVTLWEIMKRFRGKQTYYKTDTSLMFSSAVHAAVREVIEEMTEAQGLRALTEEEWKPVHRKLFKAA